MKMARIVMETEATSEKRIPDIRDLRAVRDEGQSDLFSTAALALAGWAAVMLLSVPEIFHLGT
jgi:hypothetical protein